MMTKEEIKPMVYSVLFSIFLLTTIGGSIEAFEARNKGKSGCIYMSIASFISPGYILGCELFRKRFEIGGKK